MYQWPTKNGYIESWSTTLSPIIRAPGIYTLTVTEDNGCNPVTDTVTITQDITAPSVSVSAVTTVLNCNTESITISATATVQGTASYLWSNGATTANITVATPSSYSITVTDSNNGCSVTSDSVTITQDISAPSVSVSAVTTVLTGSTESIVLTSAVEGTVHYLCSNGATTESTAVITQCLSHIHT